MASNWFADDILARYRAAAVLGITKWIGLVEAEAVRLIMTGPKTGAVYTTMFFTVGSGSTRAVIAYGARPPHQASAPGEAPANDTGYLVSSRAVSINAAALTATLTFTAAYALFLELGTDRIEPRPFARPALVNTWQAGVEAVAAEIRKVHA